MQGLSEPIGALIALVAVKPFISEEPLHYILAFVGGIMLAGGNSGPECFYLYCLPLWASIANTKPMHYPTLSDCKVSLESQVSAQSLGRPREGEHVMTVNG